MTRQLPPTPVGFMLGRPDREWIHEPGGRAFARALGIEARLIGPRLASAWAHRMPWLSRPRPGQVRPGAPVSVIGADAETAVPLALRDAKRWIVWRHLAGRKPPVGPDGRPLEDWNDPKSWMTYAEAVQVFAACDKIDGVGFVLGDGFGGVDIDECRDPETGALDDRVTALLMGGPTSYAEVSPSGKGLKMFVYATEGFVEWNLKTGAVDLRPSGYFCVTGEVLEPARVDIPRMKLNGLLEWLGTSTEEKTRERREPLARRVAPGSQEPALFREASRLRRLGYEPDEIARMLWSLVQGGRFPNEPGREPWSQADCEAKARAVAKYAPKEDTRESTDPGCAEFFHDTHGDEIAYDVDRKRWLIFDGVRWNPDKLEFVRQRLVESIRARRRLAIDSKERSAALLKREDRVTKILADAGTYFAVRVADFDRDPLLLGVPNGVVDLKTGTLRAGSPDDRISMQAAVPFDSGAACPLWEATIADIFKDKPAGFVEYMQRALGYSITGDMREEVFWLLVGIGRNGKGTLINTVHWLLGDYADSLKFASLEVKRLSDGGAGANPDTAKLHRKRFVVASEGSGAALNTALVKQITGRDPVTARYLYENEFTFIPETKLWLTTQSEKRPRVRDDSEGFWARPHELRFEQCYKGREDGTLKDKLRDEGPGILAWLVRGAVSWLAGGLQAPKCVTAAVAEYRRSQEPLADFIEANCEERIGEFASTDELREAYARWCERERIIARLGTKRLSVEFAKRFTPHRETRGAKRSGFLGVVFVDPGSQDTEARDERTPF